MMKLDTHIRAKHVGFGKFTKDLYEELQLAMVAMGRITPGPVNPLHRQSLGTAVKTSVQAANAAQKAMPPSHYVRKQQQTKAEATVAAMTPLFSGVTAALSSLAQRGADKHSSGVVQAAVMATQANAVKALEYGGDSSRHFAFLQSCMQQGLAGFGLAMPTTAAGAGSSSAQHRVMEEEDACMQQGLADMTGLTSMEHARTRTCLLKRGMAGFGSAERVMKRMKRVMGYQAWVALWVQARNYNQLFSSLTHDKQGPVAIGPTIAL
ncbi:hypothetical protein HaLaN_32437, partial [Haematococcus lacustris]